MFRAGQADNRDFAPLPFNPWRTFGRRPRFSESFTKDICFVT
ncbi:hypothetical protein OCAR_7204 [Afipia carboxidovorans OM5]|nr:hypothetical protein OCAR_7204 [Afipia carboxidovorans OM5]